MWKQIIDANWQIPYVGGWCEGFVEGAWKQATLPTVDKQVTYGVYGNAVAPVNPGETGKWNENPGNGNHPNELPPAGVTVPVYFSLGSTTAGHTAISLDDGMIASSTQGGFHTQGYIHQNLDNIIFVYGRYNGGCTYLGWSEYVGTAHVVEWGEPVVAPVDTPVEIPVIVPVEVALPVVSPVETTPIVVADPVPVIVEAPTPATTPIEVLPTPIPVLVVVPEVATTPVDVTVPDVTPVIVIKAKVKFNLWALLSKFISAIIKRLKGVK